MWVLMRAERFAACDDALGSPWCWLLSWGDPRPAGSVREVTTPSTDPAPIALSEHPHDRIAHRRTDEEWLQQVWSDPESRVLVLAGGRVRTVDGVPEWVSPDQVPDGVRLLLGERDGVVYLAVAADSSLAEGSGRRWSSLRSLAAQLPRDEAVFVVHAVGLAEWLDATRHCPYCGTRLEVREAGHQLECPQCGRRQFPRSDPAVIMVVVDGEPPHDRCLLGRHPQWPAGRYSTLAGFVEPGESIEQAVRREVAEESGIRVGRVDYFGSQPWPLPASLMLGCVARAESMQINVDGEEIEDARWFTREQMRHEAEEGSLILPGGISISRSLVEWWYGGPLPGQW